MNNMKFIRGDELLLLFFFLVECRLQKIQEWKKSRHSYDVSNKMLISLSINKVFYLEH